MKGLDAGDQPAAEVSARASNLDMREYAAATTYGVLPPGSASAEAGTVSPVSGVAAGRRMSEYRPLNLKARQYRDAESAELPTVASVPARAPEVHAQSADQIRQRQLLQSAGRLAPDPGAAPKNAPLKAEEGSRGRAHWGKPAIVIALVLLLAAATVLGARWLRSLDAVQDYLAVYSGQAPQPADTPVGLPKWMGWQHFLNMFFMVLIVRTGLQIRSERKPPAQWTPRENSFFAPLGNTPRKISLTQWLHQVLDVLWVANGVFFLILLFATGQWKRVVPTSWEIVPQMASALLQYASLHWPEEHGWIHYNALQMVAYFSVLFLAAPLAVISGLRFSTWWPQNAQMLNRMYPIRWARAIHVATMLYFVAFTIVHVLLVFFTGALRNLNHMFGSRDEVDWWGLAIFLGAVLVIASAWLLSKPLFLTPFANWMGKVSK